MKILILAPEISTPYSEGRKRFVLDLFDYFSETDQVFLLTTTKKGQVTTYPRDRYKTKNLGHGIFHLLYLVYRLPRIINNFNPDVVISFPYGSFGGLHGIASQWYMSTIDRICKQKSVLCLTIMYSIDEHVTPELLSKNVSHLAISQRPNWRGLVVNVGLKYNQWSRGTQKKLDCPTLLFMAGMWEKTTERVEHVINVRGLGDLLRIGGELSKHGVKLIVASPLLVSETCRRYLIEHELNRWPDGSLELRNLVVVPDIYHEADLFVFPFQSELKQFVPTSVLECMAAGTPVALNDKHFLKPLANNGETAFLMPANDLTGMVNVILDALSHPEECALVASRAKKYIDKNWSIKASAENIRQIVRELSSS